MRAIVFHAPGQLRLEERPDPQCRQPDDVIVRPTLTGVCGTDRNIVLGHYPCAGPRVLGHETVGIVEAVGPGVSAVVPGDRVAVNPTMWCGRCRPCGRGRINSCHRKSELELGVSRDGAMADLVATTERFVHPIPEEIPDRRAVLLEPLACVLHAADRAGLRPDDRVLVLGGGPIGLLWTMVARRLAASVAVVEMDSCRREFASKELAVLPVADLSEATLPEGHTVVVDTVGTLLAEGIDAVENGGRLVLMGCRAGVTVPIQPFTVTGRNISIIGAADYNSYDFPGVIDFARRLDCEALVTHALPMMSFEDAFGLLAVRGPGYRAMKVALLPGDQ